MTRATPEGAFVWFPLDCDCSRKIEWPIDLYVAYSRASQAGDQAEARLKLWDSGIISDMTDAARREVEIRAEQTGRMVSALAKTRAAGK